jgi:hypothetical protein
MNDSVQAEYADTPIRGRSQPYVHYTGTGTNKISFAAKLVGGVEMLSFFSGHEDVWVDAMRMKSWLYPLYSTRDAGPMQPPPKLVLNAGAIYRDVPGIIRGLDMRLSRPWNWDHMPLIIDVTIEFEILYTKPIDRAHILAYGMTDYGNKAPASNALLSPLTNLIPSSASGSVVDAIRGLSTYPGAATSDEMKQWSSDIP